ncbi:MAG: MepB family protein [Leptospira sp.]|nr:MepB family protein [Leptospira sp.]
MNVQELKKNLYDRLDLHITKYIEDSESMDYKAVSFHLNELSIISRNSKITPKKIGQFVTLWKRNSDGIIIPFGYNDKFDIVLINTKKGNSIGQFVFPKSILIKQGILSDQNQKGKLGFRIYLPSDKPTNKQALKTRNWMSEYFIEIDLEGFTHLASIRRLYGL